MTPRDGNAQLVREMFDAWRRRDIDAILASMSEDILYHNIPLAPLKGRPAVRAFLDTFFERALTFDVVFHHEMENGAGLVMNERTDIFRMRSGRDVRLPIMGVFELAGGFITAWRDYFDLGQFNG